ncbi:hypothetical protein ABIF72_011392, partial [Bradyrhizobium japonicum]
RISDGRVRSEQGPAARYNNGMVVDDQYPHVVLALITRPHFLQLCKRRERWKGSVSARDVGRSNRWEHEVQLAAPG